MRDLFIWLTGAVEQAYYYALPAAFIWGVLSMVLSPCHLTSVPLVLGYINRGGAMGVRRAFWTASCFAGGILVTIALIGGVTAAVGRLLGQTGTWTNIVVAAVLLLFGLYLLGLVRLPGNNLTANISPKRDLLGALVLGLVMGLALGPCTFAYLAPILAASFDLSSTNVGLSIGLLAAFALGHSLVIVLVGTFAGNLGRLLKWSAESRGAKVFRQTCGVLLIAGAAYLIYLIF